MRLLLWTFGMLDFLYAERKTHRTTESNTLIGHITLAMDSNRGALELNSLYPRFPVKARLDLILFRLHV